MLAKHENLISAALAAATALQLASIYYYWVFFSANGYLPSPFMYYKSDTFMDLFNTVWWSGEPGRYSVWRSVYPPLDFLIAGAVRLLFYVGAGPTAFAYRDVSVVPAAILGALALAAPFFVVAQRQWQNVAILHRFLVGAFVALSAPLLFAVERGNLILLCLFFLPVALDEDSRFQTGAIALLINLKPYFAVLLIALVVAGRWREAATATLFAGGLFLLTGLFTDPDFMFFLPNLLNFAGGGANLLPLEVLGMPSSVSAFTNAIPAYLSRSTDPLAMDGLLARIPAAAEFVKWTVLALAGVALATSRTQLAVREVMVFLLVVLLNVDIWPGGYSQIFYLACVPTLVGMRFRAVHLMLVVLVFLPLDMVTLRSIPLDPNTSFLGGGRLIFPQWQLGLGTVLRPVLNLLLCLSLSFEFALRAVPRPVSSSFSRMVPQ